MLLANAVVAYQVKRPDRSQMYLDALFELQRIHPEAAVLRTRLAIQDGNLRFARRFVDEQIELTPDHGELREVRAAVRYLGKDYAGAARDLEKALALDAPEARVRYHQGLVAEGAGRFKDAMRFYARSVELAPDETGPGRACGRSSSKASTTSASAATRDRRKNAQISCEPSMSRLSRPMK